MVQSLPHSDRSIRYTVCEPSEVPELTTMLAPTFSQSDPPAVAVGLTPAEFADFVAPVVTSQATQRLTIVGGDLRSGDLAGALLNEDAATPSPDGMGELSPKFEPILDLYGQLEDQTAQPEEIEVGTVLHLFLLGVDARFVGRGISGPDVVA